MKVEPLLLTNEEIEAIEKIAWTYPSTVESRTLLRLLGHISAQQKILDALKDYTDSL